MNIEIEVKNGFVIPQEVKLKDGIYVAKVSNQDLRTLAQNSAMHLYFTMLAKQLNDAGFSFTKVMREPSLYKMDIDWNLELVKSNLWKPIQVAIFNKESTTTLNKQDVIRIYDTANRYTSERMGISVPFPNYEEANK